MSLFKSLMFTDDPPLRHPGSNEGGVEFGPTYGNQVASEHLLRERWDRRRRDPSLHPLQHPNPCVEGCG